MRETGPHRELRRHLRRIGRGYPPSLRAETPGSYSTLTPVTGISQPEQVPLFRGSPRLARGRDGGARSRSPRDPGRRCGRRRGSERRAGLSRHDPDDLPAPRAPVGGGRLGRRLHDDDRRPRPRLLVGLVSAGRPEPALGGLPLEPPPRERALDRYPRPLAVRRGPARLRREEGGAPCYGQTEHDLHLRPTRSSPGRSAPRALVAHEYGHHVAASRSERAVGRRSTGARSAGRPTSVCFGCAGRADLPRRRARPRTS